MTKRKPARHRNKVRRHTRKVVEKLENRRAAFDRQRDKDGYTRPGSLNPRKR